MRTADSWASILDMATILASAVPTLTGRRLVFDYFAGAGGASTGIEQALGRSPDVAINHCEHAVDLPEGWGLAEAHPGVIRVVKPARAKEDTAFDPLRFRWEIGLLVSLVQGERIARKVDHVMGDVVAPPEPPEEPEYAI